MFEVKKMRTIRNKFIVVISLITVFGLMTAYAAVNETPKTAKTMGTLSVKADKEYTVLIDGVDAGKKTGISVANEILVEPGVHKIQILDEKGNARFSRDMTFVKNVKNCICLKTIENIVSRPCPYNISVDAPDTVTAGDLVTFAAFNAVSGGATALNYAWKVTPDAARITSGLGTPSITVDTSGLAGQTVRAELEVTDGQYDKECRQMVVNEVRVAEQPTQAVARKYDEFSAKAFDDDKARLDNFAIELQNNPDAQGYIIVYQGTGKTDMSRRNADKLAQKSQTYLVQNRGVPPQRVVPTNGGFRERTTYEFWIIPPGANTPAATPTMQNPRGIR
jgi:hypothetical protein